MKRIALFLMFMLSFGTAVADISIVQSTYVAPANNTSMTATFASTPTAGNLIIACTSYSQYQATRTISAESGSWTKIDDGTIGNASLANWRYVVQYGDDSAYSFTVSGTAEGLSAVLYEVSGFDTTTPINQHSIVTGSSGTSLATTAITPSVASTLAIVCSATDNGASGGLTASLPSGWTLDQSARPNYHATFGGHKNDLTSDTATSISATFTFSGASGGHVGTAVLIAPQASASSSSNFVTNDSVWNDTTIL